MKINTLWNEEYRPKTIDDCIIPTRIKSILENRSENTALWLLKSTVSDGQCSPSSGA